MKRLLLLMLGIAFFSVVNAQMDTIVNSETITIKRSGGKYNKHIKDIGYNYVKEVYDEYGNIIYLECKGKGNIACPNIVPSTKSFQQLMYNAILNLETMVYNELKEGKRSGEYIYQGIKFSYSDAQIVTNEYGKENLKYDLTISCQTSCNIENINDFIYIKITGKEEE
jgi:hypothetical protein